MLDKNDWYLLSENKVLNTLETGKDGLSKKEVSRRLEKYGKNELREKRKISPLKIFLNQFRSVLVIILILATIISLFIGEIIDGILILIIIVMNAIFGFVQDYKAEKAIEALKKMGSVKARVIRNGKEMEISAENLVPGDIIILEEGGRIPADARLLNAINLELDESALTGESVGVEKKVCEIKERRILASRTNMAFMNTNILRGKGLAVVVNTGMDTEIGKIAEEVDEIKKDVSPFQKKLDNLGKRIGIVVLVMILIIFITQFLMHTAPLITIFLIAISLAVAAVPEGLPAVVTLSLAMGVKRMAKRNSLARRLTVVEGLGLVDVICTDKTGTLTENRMTVRRIWFNSKEIEVTGRGYEQKGEFILNKKPIKPKSLELILKAGMLCNNSSRGYDEEGNEKFLGDPTEISLVVSATKAGLKEEELEKEYKRIHEIPFSSESKKMTTIHEIDNKKVVFMKGAPEVVLEHCSKIYDNGRYMALSEGKKKEILKKNEEFAGNALRVLGFAFKEDDKNPEKNLVFLGLQGMMDPPRKEVKDAINSCKQAGIRVVMITGDHKNTARAVAREISLVNNDVIDGEELTRINDEELREKVKKVDIFARVSPEDKIRILKALKSNGHVVAMTGDGVNDAPAVKLADTGIAMGIRGTEVTKQTSDMILLDDNFATINAAVEEGRRIFDNIKKFVNYLLSSNLAEVLIVFSASLAGLPLPLTAVQLLWINLLTDGLPALALGADPAEPNIMKRRPRRKNEGIIDKSMAVNILFIGVAMSAIILTMFYYNVTNIMKAQTIVFTSLVLFELVRVQIIRSEYKLGLFSNKYLILAMLSSLLLQLLVVYSPLNKFFGTVALGLNEWMLMLAGLFVFFTLSYLFNRIKRFVV